METLTKRIKLVDTKANIIYVNFNNEKENFLKYHGLLEHIKS